MNGHHYHYIGFLSISIIAFGPSYAASQDTFLLAASFALTGTDGAALEVIDRQNCIFRIGKATFYLNEVYTDRLTIPAYEEQYPGKVKTQFSVVKLHGASPVYQYDNTYSQKEKGDFFSKAQIELPDRPPTLETDYDLRINTNEAPRLTRAWQYIYQHGCRGKASPF